MAINKARRKNTLKHFNIISCIIFVNDFFYDTVVSGNEYMLFSKHLEAGKKL